MLLAGKKILIGITGSIAAYKMIYLTRILTKQGAEVKIIMTEAATQFVSPLVLSTLSGNKVQLNLFENDVWANHVELGRWADIFLIAPLSCNTLAKLATGLCDNLLLSVYLSAKCPVMLAPAMDEDMWHHGATKRNLAILQSDGNIILSVGHGGLASGLIGEGRMAEPEEMFVEIISFFKKDNLKGHKVLISSGPTQEAIDPVRYISNHSTGKMGVALAEAFYLQGAEVILISGPAQFFPRFKEIQVIKIQNAEQLHEKCLQFFPQVSIAVMAAAVADYTPIEVAIDKIKKKNETLDLNLKKTKDILKDLGEVKKDQVLVGFALETTHGLTNAKQKLEAKNADFMVLNSMEDQGAGFSYDTNKVTILSRDGSAASSSLMSKFEIANFIIENIQPK